ncbi:MAG: hypothetical protein HY514_04425 [Candidatus Aenigmarchaeota archaeon]|nr:hypothetical protein [Candidatus Aenigmarchaeota archaeon]
MSKRFKSQDYFRYPKLRTKWRRPKGRQSKLRKRKGGSGLQAAIGYGTKNAERNKVDGMRFSIVRSLGDLEHAQVAIIISRSLGAKKTQIIADKAKQMKLKILNAKKIRKSAQREQEIVTRKQVKKKEVKKTAETKEEKVETTKESNKEKKMGFHESVVPQLMKGKTKTYRMRDHGFRIGDVVKIENTQKGETIGHAKIINVERMPLSKIDLKDKGHYKTYEETGELIEAFKRHYPEKNVTPETEVFIYTYEFTPEKTATEAEENKETA